MPRHKKGTLGRVKPEALVPNAGYTDLNNGYVKSHGYLWLIERWSERNRYYECKSIATGRTGIAWLASEITTRKGEDDA